MLPEIQTIDPEDLKKVTCLRCDGTLGTLRDQLASFAPEEVLSAINISPKRGAVREIASLSDSEVKTLALSVFKAIEGETVYGMAINAMTPVEQISQFSPMGESMINSAKTVLLHTELLIKAGKVEFSGD